VGYEPTTDALYVANAGEELDRFGLACTATAGACSCLDLQAGTLTKPMDGSVLFVAHSQRVTMVTCDSELKRPSP
jgi:hypothetical protein